MYCYHFITLDHYTLLSCQNSLSITKLETCKLCEGIHPQSVAGRDAVSWPETRFIWVKLLAMSRHHAVKVCHLKPILDLLNWVSQSTFAIAVFWKDSHKRTVFWKETVNCSFLRDGRLQPPITFKQRKERQIRLVFYCWASMIHDLFNGFLVI